MKKFISTIVLAGLLAISGIHVGEMIQDGWKPAVPAVQKITDTFRIINGEAWITLDSVNAYSYEQFRENLIIVKARKINKMHLIMLNPGGSIYHMWSMYDMLKAAIDNDGLILYTHMHNFIASAAVPIFLLGEVRTMQPHGYIMIHSHNVPQSDHQPETFNAMVAQWTESYIAILLERTTMSEEEIRKYLCNDGNPRIQFWMNYSMAEARGFLKPALETTEVS